MCVRCNLTVRIRVDLCRGRTCEDKPSSGVPQHSRDGDGALLFRGIAPRSGGAGLRGRGVGGGCSCAHAGLPRRRHGRFYTAAYRPPNRGCAHKGWGPIRRAKHEENWSRNDPSSGFQNSHKSRSPFSKPLKTASVKSENHFLRIIQ